MRRHETKHVWQRTIRLIACASLFAAPVVAQPNAPFTVVLDAAHGKGDPGVTLSSTLLEKDIVLQLSIHLRSALNARGIAVQTTRETDGNPSASDRTAIANHARAGACVILHATAAGSGVHLYTSSESPTTPLPQSTPRPWKSAAGAHSIASLKLASDIETAMNSAGVPHTQGRVRMESLDSMDCPAVAVEVAPLRPFAGSRGTGNAALDDAEYQARLVDALAAALVQWRGEAETKQ